MNRFRLVFSAMMAALGTVLMLFVQVPLLPSADYLLYDPSDVPILAAGAIAGPFWAIAAALVKSTLFLLLKGAGGPLGALANFLATAAYVGVASLVWTWLSRRDTGRAGIRAGRLAAAGAAGTVSLALFMVPVNLVIVPTQFGVPAKVVLAGMLPLYIPFNLLRGIISTALATLALPRFVR